MKKLIAIILVLSSVAACNSKSKEEMIMFNVSSILKQDNGSKSMDESGMYGYEYMFGGNDTTIIKVGKIRDMLAKELNVLPSIKEKTKHDDYSSDLKLRFTYPAEKMTVVLEYEDKRTFETLRYEYIRIYFKPKK